MNTRRTRGRSMLAIVAVLVGVLVMSASASAAKSVVYDNIVNPLPGNFASIGYEATSTAEFGGQVQLAGTARKHPSVTVAMSAWACQEGNSSRGETCRTPKPKRKFAWPLTLNVYEVGPGGTVGTKLASETQTFKMPYRPDTSYECTQAGDAGAWYDAAAPGTETIEKCFHGMAFTVRFKPLAATLPQNVIVSVAYNTSNHGEKPVGAAACQSTYAGCYYDSLNVSIIEPSEGGATVGSDPDEELFVNSGWNEMYCGSSASLNTFAPTGKCWEGDQPALEVEAAG